MSCFTGALRIAIALAAATIAVAQEPAGRVRVLLDTDAFNEIDDQFFIAYSLFQDNWDVEGITAAHYLWENGSVDESYFEIRRILEVMGRTPSYPIVRGADVPMRDEKSPQRSEASALIARLANKTDARPLYILAVGALTNVASALTDHPEIKPKVRIIWLGGFPPDGRMTEFNCRNDRAAVKAVFESGADLTVVPTETSARFLTMPLEEAGRRLRHTNLLGRTLFELLRDYGERRGKVIWDISVTAYLRQLTGGPRFFQVSKEPAPRIDLAKQLYVRGQGPHRITVCGKPDREAVFADFFRHLPSRRDTEPPYLLSALAFGKEMRLLFSEPLDGDSANRRDCYSIAKSIQTVRSGDNQVTLELSGSPPASIAATCVRDEAGQSMLASRNSAAVHSAEGALPGLRYAIYRSTPGVQRIPAAEGAPVQQGTIGTLDWPSEQLSTSGPANLIVAEGHIYLPLDHRYEFFLQGNRFARVFLDEELLLDQGRDGDRRAQRTTFRKRGLYKLRVELYTERGTPRLTFMWNLPFHEMSVVPPAVLLHMPDARR